MGDNIYSDELPEEDWLRAGLARYSYNYSCTLLPMIYSQIFVAQLFFPRAASFLAIFLLYFRQQHINRCLSQDLSDWEKIQDSQLMIATVLSMLRFVALSSGLWVVVSSFPKSLAIVDSCALYAKNMRLFKRFFN